MPLTHFCGFRIFIAKFSSYHDFAKIKFACLYRHRFILKHPAVAETPEKGDIVENLICRSALYIDEPNSYPYTVEEYAATNKVPNK